MSIETPSHEPSGCIAPVNAAQAQYWWDISSGEARIASNQAELQNPEISEIDRERLLAETRTLLYDKYRLQRPAVLMHPVFNKNAELREFAINLFGEEFEKDRKGFIDSLSVETLLAMETMGPGTLAKFYAFRETIDESGGLRVENVDIRNVTPGETIQINFGANLVARESIRDEQVIPAEKEAILVS